MAFEKKEDYEPLRDALWEKFGGREPGTTIVWAEFEVIVNQRHHEHPAAMLIQQFRQRLYTEREIVTTADGKYRGVGVHLLADDEVIGDHLELRNRRGWRHENRTIRHLRTVTVTKLTDHQRRIHDAQVHMHKYARLQHHRAKSALRQARKPTEVNPRRKPPK
jgi:hypothetical protein